MKYSLIDGEELLHLSDVCSDIKSDKKSMTSKMNVKVITPELFATLQLNPKVHP